MIDPNSLMLGLSAIKEVIGILKLARDLLPDNSDAKQSVTANLEQAERQLLLAEASTMQSLGYELCRNHPIPQIMLSMDDKNWTCPTCGNKKFTGINAPTIERYA